MKGALVSVFMLVAAPEAGSKDGAADASAE
jgi:hypothetical protein